MEKMDLFLPGKPISAEIFVGRQLFAKQKLFQKWTSWGNDLAVITDEHVRKVHSPFFEKLEKEIPGLFILAIPPGEQQKSRKTKEFLEDKLLQKKYGRDSCIIAVGGGVITDLAGFLAATYCRGIPLILVPTSLLAMVDAAIGGKTAVNTPYGKNIIGCFYHPKQIMTDISWLETLPDKEMREGMAEILKHSLILDKDLFALLEDAAAAFYEKNPDLLFQLIKRNIFLKKEVVQQDETEQGLRSILNFGHTIGHSIELAEDYQISHGEAVALGIWAETNLSRRLGFIEKHDVEKIHSVLKKYQFPLSLSSKVSMEKLLSAMKLDKKSIKSEPRFVLLESIGKVYRKEGRYCHPVEKKYLEETLEELLTFAQKNYE